VTNANPDGTLDPRKLDLKWRHTEGRHVKPGGNLAGVFEDQMGILESNNCI